MPIIAAEIKDQENGRSDVQKARAVNSRKEIFGFSEIFGTRASTHLTDEQRAQRFWMGVIYASFVGYWVIGLIIFGYALLTWEQPNRYLITANSAVALVFAATFYGVRYKIVAVSWRLWFFGGVNFCSFVSLSLVCILDDGANSVLTFLLFLPMMYLASGYPLKSVVICGGLGLLSYGILVACTSAPVPVTAALLQVTGLSVGWLLALSGAANRRRQDNEAQYLRQRLEALAITDDLTGCLNQRAFLEALDHEIERAARYGHCVALLTIDVDYFKRINDNHGHLMGDDVLRQIGACLRQTARDTDVAGRPGGDELALLAPEADPAEARALAERLQQDMQALKTPLEITLSQDGSTPIVAPADQSFLGHRGHQFAGAVEDQTARQAARVLGAGAVHAVEQPVVHPQVAMDP